ncbi:MAG TPA: amidohydrolase family protein [Longimicrobiales bacterium]|nr:amidohydrolase family protein [Longimicrobiales bacterium]
MFINGHAHIFTLQSVLSRHAITIMAGRLRRMGLHDFIVDAVEELLDAQLDRPEYLVEDELLVRFMRAIARSASFQNLAASVQLPVEVRLLSGAADQLEVRAMRAALDRLSSWIDSNDGPGKSPFDVFETLRIAMQPTIPRVADKLLAHLGPDDAIVALMMDIVAENESDRDRRNFLGQIRGTTDAVLARPGRVLPFIAVNPHRADHFDIMRRAIEEQGFVGVKLYPSLGYEMNTPAIRNVIAYCRTEDVPITIHCTATGFARDAESAGYSHPKHWLDLFTAPGDTLRVCFAHCGGWGGFCGEEADQIEWAETILSYMDEHPNVFADLSYHVEMMALGGAAETAYFTALKELLAGPHAHRIIFGTDSWLVRLNIDDAAYWSYFRTMCTPAEFALLAGTTPRRFLGIPATGAPAAANIARHIEFLERHADQVGSAPAQWVRDLSTATWSITRGDSTWSRNNYAHVAAYNYFKTQIPPRLRGTGFDDCGLLRLRQLDYFGSGARPSDTKLKGVSRNLMTQCEAYGGIAEGSYTSGSIQPLLIQLLADGDRALADVGGSLDAFYLFAPEIA